MQWHGGMLIHGGWTDAGGDAQQLHNGVLCDVQVLQPRAEHQLDMALAANPPPKGPWSWWSPAVTGQPPRRSHHTLTAVDWRPELVLAVGGWDGFRRVPHVHALDMAAWAWSAVRPVGDTPVGVSDHACASLPSGSILVLGRAAGGQAEWTDKWELSCEAAADGPGLVAEWTCLTKNGGSLAARTGHSLTLCAGADGARRLLVLGGRATPMVESLHTGAADDAAAGGALWSSLEEPLGGAAAAAARARRLGGGGAAFEGTAPLPVPWR